MAITSYATLQTAVGNWLNRSDLSSLIPEFIQVAEARFNRIVRTPDMLSRDDAFEVATQYEPVPTGFLEAKRVVLLTNPVVQLEYLTPEELSEKRYTLSSAAKPIYYTVAGGNFEFLPTPGDTYTASVLYFKKLDGLATTDPNWLLTSHPDIYLYGALVEAAPYIIEDERIPVWQSKLDRALAELNIAGQRQSVGGTPVARFRSFG